MGHALSAEQYDAQAGSLMEQAQHLRQLLLAGIGTGEEVAEENVGAIERSTKHSSSSF